MREEKVVSVQFFTAIDQVKDDDDDDSGDDDSGGGGGDDGGGDNGDDDQSAGLECSRGRWGKVSNPIHFYGSEELYMLIITKSNY